MDFLSAILGPVVESLLVPVKKHLGYLFFSTKHVRNMSTKMKQLHGTSVDVKTHMERNDRSNLEIPARVPAWLEEVEKIKEDAQDISSNVVNGCFNLKMRYRAGRKAFKTTQEIEGHIKEHTETSWTDAQIPLGKVSSKKASTSGPSDDGAQNDFKSREKVFKEALGLLQQDHTAQVIALCGMGGVGKTTMMEQLKKAVEDKKMFDWIGKEVIGQKVNIFSIQQTIAEYLQIPLTETSKTARADRLHVTFAKRSQERKEKVLVILDDVWEKVELKDIGLSPLPNGFKLLLTSRNENICKEIAVEANSDLRVVRVDVMKELEANNFFCQITRVSKENDPILNDIGVEIVRRCGFLPLAIKIIATNLKSQEKSVWRDILKRLKKKDLDIVQEVVEISYTFIKEEEVKAIFLLCGLFPDDYNIPIENLTRYAWGLKLLNEVSNLEDARDRTKTCILKLRKANLLMHSDYLECVKMHDLVLDFVVAKVSKCDHHPWIINHGEVSNWNKAKVSDSCRRISLTCMGMSEFPRDFNHPNVSLLKLMNGDKSLKFPDDFYEKMKNLQVMSYEKLQYPLLPRSLQCSTKLRTLCLHECKLMFDCSAIGDHLLNLEVLSFARSRIRYLPSSIGNLDKLKLLDLTDCIDLRIDEDVLKKLIKLEELYMRVAHQKRGRFIDMNYKELTECSKNLSALEVEFIKNNHELKNMSYNKLERFKISMGGFLSNRYSGKDTHSSENTLELVANKDEVLESGLNVLFQKTEVLLLKKVGGMNNLEEVLPKPVSGHWFCNLKDLNVSECRDSGKFREVWRLKDVTNHDLIIGGFQAVEEIIILGCKSFKNIFTPNTAKFDLGALRDIHTYGGGHDESVEKSSQTDVVISWSLCHFSRNIQIDQCDALSTVIPFNGVGKLQMLETLIITSCQSMREIFEIAAVRSANMIPIELPSLQILHINRCDLLEHVFTSSTLESLKQLKELTITECKAMQVIVKEDGEHTRSAEVVVFPNLKSLTLTDLPNVKAFFRGTNEFRWPRLDEVKIYGCPQMEVFTSGLSMTPKLSYMHTGVGKHSLERGLNFQLTHETPDMINLLQYPWSFSNLIEVDVSSSKLLESRIIFPYNELHKLQNLEKLNVILPPSYYRGRIVVAVKEVFEVVERKNDYMNETQSVEFSKLKQVTLERLRSVKHIWKSNPRIVLNFPNLTKVFINYCPLLGHVFTSCMVGSLLQLQELHISACRNMEVVVKQEEDHCDTRANEVVDFPRLKSLTLMSLEKLKGFYLGSEAFTWPSLDTLEIKDCPQITVFTYGQSTAPELKMIDTSFGLCDATEDPTSFIKTKQQESWEF